MVWYPKIKSTEMATSLGIFFLSGLHLTCLSLYLCLLLLTPCKYVPKCLFFSICDKLYTQAWGKFKIGRWYNHSSMPRVLFGIGTCDNLTQWRDLGSILCQREYSCLAWYFQVIVEVENLYLPLTHLGLLGRSAVANREYSWIGWYAILHPNETTLQILLEWE